MFNLHQILGALSATGWVLLSVSLLLWVGFTYYMGEFSERKWGDRESGALIGFFLPGAALTAVLYFN